MKNLLKNIFNGLGIGIGFGLMFIGYFVVTDILDSHAYDNESYFLNEEPPASETAGLLSDDSVTDKDMMELFSGSWWGITWNPSNQHLYSYRWEATPDGELTIHFDYINQTDRPNKEESGTWWIKKPFLYTKTESCEATYKPLYVSQDYIVYQLVIDNDRPIPNGRIFVISKSSTLLDNLRSRK